MNIFKVLSRGYGKVSETNVSAFLGFLLDPKEQHGIGKLFLGRFIGLIKSKLNNENHSLDNLYVNDELSKELTKKFSIEIEIEKELPKTNRIDVELFFKNKDTKTPSTSQFLIEMKINDNAVQYDQINKYLDYLKNESKADNKLLIFLALNSEIAQSTAASVDKEQTFVFVSWDEIVNLLSDLIKDHSNGEIDPIQNSTLVFLVSFKQFILSNFQDDVDPKEMKYRIEVNNEIFYSNFAIRSLLIICQELIRQGQGGKLITFIKKLNKPKIKEITSFGNLIIDEKAFKNYENKNKEEANKRFFTKEGDILNVNNKKWYLTTQLSEEGVVKFVERLEKGLLVNLTITNNK